MARTGARWRAALLGAAVGVGLLASPAGAQDPGATTTTAPAPTPEVSSAVPNPTVLGPIPISTGLRRRLLTTPLEALADHGYVEQELFFGGRAGVHDAKGEWGPDGVWETTSGSTRPYRTRMLVRRPADPAAFNGTVVVSWLDVSGAFDADAEWAAVGSELMREGAAYVAVSAQALGVGGPLGAAAWDPTRYGSLHLGDDALSYDVFSQAAQAVKHPQGVDPLGELSKDRRLIAVGRSQAAQRLVTYINAFQPVAQLYDGFLLTSRFPNAAPLGDAEVGRSRLSLAGALDTRIPFLPDPRTALRDGIDDARIREDTEVPVLVVLSETDVIEAYGARQPDGDLLRTWEVAGSAHLDETVVGSLTRLLARDFPVVPLDQLTGCPTPNAFPASTARRAAQRAIESWVVDGTAPAAAARLTLDDGEIARDDLGNALGGLRLPDIDVPTAVHTGASDGNGFCSLLGGTTRLDDDEIDERYPNHDDYVALVTASANKAVKLGHLLSEDASAIVAAAAAADVGGATVAGSADVAGAAAPGAGEVGAATPAGGATPAAPVPTPEETAVAERSDPGWMATTGWDLIAPLLVGMLLLVNGRVVLTIAHGRRRGTK